MVPREGAEYDQNGNVLFDDFFRLLASTIYPSGVDFHPFRGGAGRAILRSLWPGLPMWRRSAAPRRSEVLAMRPERSKPDRNPMISGIDFTVVVVPNGSSGTQAGLVAGYRALGIGTTRVHGPTRCLRPLPAPMRRRLRKPTPRWALLGFELALSSAGRRGLGSPIGCQVTAFRRPAMVDAVRLMASREGLLLDPVYGGKAFAGLLADISAGRYRAGDDVLFIMTGGTSGAQCLCDPFPRRGAQGSELSDAFQALPRRSRVSDTS